MDNTSFHKKQQPVNAQINTGLLKDQLHAREALLKIVSSLKFLSEQGLSLRGKESSGENFRKLLELRAEDVAILKSWLGRKQNFTSGEIQTELLQIMSHTILRQLCEDINSMSGQFGIIVNGTQYIQRVEHESVCLRYVTNTFEVREDFIWLYDVSSTTGQAMSKTIVDVLIRLQLPLEHLRAQTYDGASNMSGKYNGCQAEMKKNAALSQICSLWRTRDPSYDVEGCSVCTIHQRVPRSYS